jgi:hypothetical protein|tara:strand:+ start:655 stop:1119 length:465 start_codon:yes stop_codon:yes gene_type:complete
MNPQSLADLHQKLRAIIPLSEVISCGVHVTNRQVQQQEDVVQAIEAFNPVLGSLTRIGRYQWLSGGFDGGDADPILDAELLNADGHALQVRHLGAAWQLTTLIHQPEGTTHLADEVERLGRPPAPTRLIYRRYWQVVPGEATTAVCAALIGAQS